MKNITFGFVLGVVLSVGYTASASMFLYPSPKPVIKQIATPAQGVPAETLESRVSRLEQRVNILEAKQLR